ncbi:MAG: ribonuclease HIII [Planctomycetes bacterium]|nr:ribonuclease HIII [Planctomycetota bacterium]
MAAGFITYCNDLVARAKHAGWSVVSEKSIPYGRQWQLTDRAGFKAVLNAYSGKKGFKFHVGGKDAPQLNEALGGMPVEASGEVTTTDPFGLGLPRIGGDESGKGDFFGPLVVAAFHLDAMTEKTLAKSGITDSKKLSDAQIQKLAGLLDKTGRGHVMRLMPREYNPSYRKVGNLNVLLAQMHGKCVQGIMKTLGAPGAVLIDEFARDGKVLRAAIAAPAGVKVVTRTKGEADLAVAAASILARAEFIRSLKELEHEFGQAFPPGAGTPVLKAGRDFVKSFGRDQLASVAKLHFKTIDSL